MEVGDILRRSLRSGSSSIWRNTEMDVFSRSMKEDGDDEEALKWAALEKLPTYDRLRKGILTTSRGGVQEIEVDNLGLQEKQHLFDKLLRFVEEDNERFLLKLKTRIDRVGIELPTIEVRFEHLNVEAEALEASRALPTFINFMADIIEGFLKTLHILPSHKKHLNILKNISGIIKPSRMTLLLGPPGSGKTTLLLALAGKLDQKLKCSGRVTYNGYGMNEFVPRRTAAYISQHDLHLAQLTVRETLAFSARCQGVGTRHHMLAELLRREKAANIKPDPDLDMFMKAVATEGQVASVITDYVLKILGLDICADTMVGNEMLRGISGGQRKRLTTGEMLVGPARALFMDEISTGLDSSTAFQIVNSIRQSNHILYGTALISLLQPAPETYELFDDIILLSEGQIVYQGPREHVLEFFERMGFRCPERKGVADFLQEVTSKKDQQQYWAQRNVPYRFVTVREFAEAFNSFHVGRKLAEELSTPFDKSKCHPAALATEKYGVGKMELFKTCFSRELLLLKRNAPVYISKTIQLFFVALITATVFLRTKFHKDSITDGTLYMGSLFFAIMVFLFSSMAEISLTIAKLPVFYKQRDLLFYPPWSFSLPPWIIKSPITFIDVGVWVFCSYYVIGYDSNAGRLFKQYLLLVLLGQMASALFRFTAASGRIMVIANTFGSFALLLLIALGGFVLSHDDIKKWWIWGYWSSPLMYAQNGLSVNELRGHSWSQIPPNSAEPLGVQVLRSRGIFTEPSWYWIGVGALIGFIIVLNLSFTLALTFLSPFEKSRATISQEAETDAPGDKTEHNIQLSTIETHGEIGRSNSNGGANHIKKKGMILPFEPYSITFDDITYSVDMPAEMAVQGVVENRLVLLREVSGAFRPGVLTALMGVSGAGKTTLMDVLAGRKTGGYIDGNITISGYPKKQETFARISGYCEQNDIHSPNLTVYESLLYSAWLRLPGKINAETRKMFIEEVMELVELNSIRRAIVGLPGENGLSTEQRKRLTIAVELVANPSIIFMDEPTSGLDARAAAIVMRTVRNTVDTGRTVVCTIHQPSIDIFESFDELLLLKRGGQEIYAGPLGHHSSQLIKYYQSIPGVSRIRDGYNPATWMLEVTTPAQEVALGVDFVEVYKNSELFRRNKALIKELSVPVPGSKDLYFPTQYSQPEITQFMACLWKQHWSYWRNPPYTAVRLLFTTGIALLFGTMFWDMGKKTERQVDLYNAMGSMYAAVFFIGVQNAMSVQPVVAIERSVFYRERAAGMYSAIPYAIAQIIIEIPYAFVQAVIYGVVVYAMIGFEWTMAKFFWYLFFMYFTMLYFTYYGMMAVALTPNVHISTILSSMFYSLWNLFSGFIVVRPRIPIWWRWYTWACPVAWSLYGLFASQFGDIKKTINGGDETVEHYVRHYFGFRHDFLGDVSAAVIGFALLFALIYAICIKQLNFQRR